MKWYSKIIRPVLFRLYAEKAHDLTFRTLSRLQESDAFLEFVHQSYRLDGAEKALEVKTSGITFPNPVGLAAGFDKNAKLIPVLQALGFGFLEIGSLTAKPAPGNPKPRMFRLPEDRALINRMGLNNDGAAAVIDAVQKMRNNETVKIPLGINIAKTPRHDISGDAALADYRESYRLALQAADYINVNISCPNTGDGKTFESPDVFSSLIKTLRAVPGSDNIPMFIKFSSDTDPDDLGKILQIAENLGVDGYVAVNTSTKRSGLKTPASKLNRIGPGGLSGAPVASIARRAIIVIRENTASHKTVISVGGIDSPEEASHRISLGADLIQLYSGLVFEGPDLVREIKRKLQA